MSEWKIYKWEFREWNYCETKMEHADKQRNKQKQDVHRVVKDLFEYWLFSYGKVTSYVNILRETKYKNLERNYF